MSDTLERLRTAMGELAAAPGKMDFRGKAYAPVAMRVEFLRRAFGTEVGIATEIVTIDERVVIVRATISDGAGRTLATGYAEEFRSNKGVNSTSALENAETSAVGRALAALGLGGGEYASADELAGAVHQQKQAEQQASAEEQRRQVLMEAVHANQASIDAIKAGLEAGDLSTAAEAWFELDDRTKQSLWVAPSNGGPFTTRERETMKSAEFREAYYGPAQQQTEEATA
ncbi:hypothetical protein ACFQH5_20475 [Halomonas salifodinae]|uniref:Uncharacterized protein n=1 Tax=Halomonas salifodinae TaxID=438745 RepID=A0ABW2F4D5_9GAMM